uniref:GDP-Man:Man(3)GlcNAc(2)-PP-Dol alpha-1,2-mannosyltransferase n=1 Tax=Chromera velia CCMP2878 TaxID=1169474 RepID=A0A0G4HKM1_9ALVE|eukprot:Cvel_7259.t1-p1 / transcript=Cvel_7259.t1 / gene=Cvel_7259 / organism=Chromera_velia_CCMP2878 / gene_product=GDP-Man:Man(3)GlcNAc(2)-PP-Dol, putative / transcript_product=GDP-Man:Man(3)GlcNAc(2)-PP-Dol, putative / location=Cvel_scaffold375:4662-9172(-) / protein_length=548 / sequence_SO=supercontig / SO=protein_coding / is_pseudo=false
MSDRVLSWLFVSVLLLVLNVFPFWVFSLFVFSVGILLRICQVQKTIGFFHPFCDGGGGGERVLWCLVEGLLQENTAGGAGAGRRGRADKIVIYSKSCKPDFDILSDVKQRFGIDILNAIASSSPNPARLTSEEECRGFCSTQTRLEFKRLSLTFLANPDSWPVLTILCQSVGAGILSLECLLRFAPEVFCDTTGYPCSYPVARLFGGCEVACYTHYPTVSTDMLETVRSGASSFNNSEVIARSSFLTRGKLLYYRMLGFLYQCCGSCAGTAVANSKWTQAHIQRIWKKEVPVVYPPTDIRAFRAESRSIEEEDYRRKPWIVSVAQFRPEKNHRLQLKAFERLVEKHGNELPPDTRLILCGSTRGEKDELLVNDLKMLQLQMPLQVKRRIEFKLNLSLPDLIAQLHESKVAVHTMVNEHFGISLVEFLAAGCVVVAHDSGGPKLDILRTAASSTSPSRSPGVDRGRLGASAASVSSQPGQQREEFQGGGAGGPGYLATTEEEFADCMWDAVMLGGERYRRMKDKIAQRVAQFPDNRRFAASCIEALRLR